MLHKANCKPQALKERNIIAPGFNPGLINRKKNPAFCQALQKNIVKQGRN